MVARSENLNTLAETEITGSTRSLIRLPPEKVSSHVEATIYKKS